MKDRNEIGNCAHDFELGFKYELARVVQNYVSLKDMPPGTRIKLDLDAEVDPEDFCLNAPDLIERYADAMKVVIEF